MVDIIQMKFLQYFNFSIFFFIFLFLFLLCFSFFPFHTPVFFVHFLIYFYVNNTFSM